MKKYNNIESVHKIQEQANYKQLISEKEKIYDLKKVKEQLISEEFYYKITNYDKTKDFYLIFENKALSEIAKSEYICEINDRKALIYSTHKKSYLKNYEYDLYKKDIEVNEIIKNSFVYAGGTGITQVDRPENWINFLQKYFMYSFLQGKKKKVKIKTKNI